MFENIWQNGKEERERETKKKTDDGVQITEKKAIGMHNLLDDWLLSFVRNSLALFPKKKKNTYRMSRMAFYVQYI